MAHDDHGLSKLIALATPVATASAILYQHLYWYSFGIVIFEFLSFGSLIGYFIVPLLFATGILFLAYLFVLLIPLVRSVRWGVLVLGIVVIAAVGIQAWFIGRHVLWIFLPLVGAPLVAGGLDLIKPYRNIVSDPKTRSALSFSVCLVVLSGAAAGKMQAGGVLSRTDYYTIDILREPRAGISSHGVRWIYLGKADSLLFLQSEKNASIVVTRVDEATPFVFTHHQNDRTR
ncbi:MAG TPA: hypothetical protein VGC93_11980 [Thermoanaerobaculia bacterium]